MEELEKLGYKVDFSLPCPMPYWGKWFISAKAEKHHVMGYGDDEAGALADVLKVIENRKKAS